MVDLTQTQIHHGLDQCKGFTGYFTLPKFREMCMSLGNEFPDVHLAYREACLKPTPKDRQKWTHPVVYHAAVATGWYELHALTENQIFPAYKRHYEEMCRRSMAGEDMTIHIRQALPEYPFVEADPEKGQESIKKMRAILEGK